MKPGKNKQDKHFKIKRHICKTKYQKKFQCEIFSQNKWQNNVKKQVSSVKPE